LSDKRTHDAQTPVATPQFPSIPGHKPPIFRDGST
jgi:hypothetical protein